MRVVAIAQQREGFGGRKMRVDTTVVEARIHYPTDSSLFGGRTRSLFALAASCAPDPQDAPLHAATPISQLAPHRSGDTCDPFHRAGQGKEKSLRAYEKLLSSVSRVVG